MSAPYHYQWEWSLHASPAEIWPLIADTNRTTRDSGTPPAQRLSLGELTNAYQRLRINLFGGLALEWEEQPFEWTRPEQFRVLRQFNAGPIAQMIISATLQPRPEGGTTLQYTVQAWPKNLLGHVVIPFQVGWQIPRLLKAALDQYDQVATRRQSALTLPAQVFFTPGGQARLATARANLLAQGADPDLAHRLLEVIERGDNFLVARLRPYALADGWQKPRPAVLELCLQATRLGLLTLQWEVLCPLCRGAKQSVSSLGELDDQAHCGTCHIDFDANFDRAVELTFRPAADIRFGLEGEFCVGGPQVTPHIVAQQLLQPGETRAITLPLEVGRYRLRALELRGHLLLTATPTGDAQPTFEITESGWPNAEPRLSLRPTLRLVNRAAREQLIILERAEWSDQAVTAAEVTALQIFRDLFANEALRPGERFSVGRITVVFTDLRGSTKLYRDNGDAVAFGRVMSHFDVLKDAIAAHEGALVKTIGDAVMAVFLRPLNALQAILVAQAQLAAPKTPQPLQLKAGIHTGPCVAVTLNDRLDYFGSTVNLAARLESISAQHTGLVVSAAVHDDPEVQQWLAQGAARATPFETEVKGFEGEIFALWEIAL